MTGLLFLQHGAAKLLKIPVIPMLANPSLTSLPGIAGILELVGGVLMILGLFTRSTAFILSGLMGVSSFMAHAPRGFSIRSSMPASWQPCTASSSSTSPQPGRVPGASTPRAASSA